MDELPRPPRLVLYLTDFERLRQLKMVRFLQLHQQGVRPRKRMMWLTQRLGLRFMEFPGVFTLWKEWFLDGPRNLLV